MMPLHEFKHEVDFVLPVIGQYLDESTGEGEEEVPSRAALHQLGWTGLISSDMRGFLLSRYERFHPMTTTEERQHMMATYLACALARRRLKMSGVMPEWTGGSLGLSFAPPTPDDPSSAPRVFYRTVTMDQSKMHIAPWRAKGVIKIDGDQPRLTVMHWGDPQLANLVSGALIVSDGQSEVEIGADYLITQQ